MDDSSEHIQHLRLLAIFHYVYGGLTALVFCFPIIHVALGVIALMAPEQLQSASPDQFPRAAAILFIGVGGSIMLFGWSIALLTVLTGRWLVRRKRYTFCLVIACLECMSMPIGTVLGIFTLIVLTQAPVRNLFEQHTSRTS